MRNQIKFFLHGRYLPGRTNKILNNTPKHFKMKKKLFRVIVAHASPRDICRSTACLVLANNDEQVFDFIASEPDIRGETYFVSWGDLDEDSSWTKEELIETKGAIDNEQSRWDDAYYGVLHLGWELLDINSMADYSELIKLGMLFDVSSE